MTETFSGVAIKAWFALRRSVFKGGGLPCAAACRCPGGRPGAFAAWRRFAGVFLAALLSAPLAAQSPSVCDRAPPVRDTIVGAVPGTNACALITAPQLAAITELDLAALVIGALVPSDLSGLSGLRILRLNDNRLTALEPGLFDSLVSLQELALHGNQIAALPSDIFARLRELRTLSLDNNNLSALPADTFSALTRLTEVSLSDNQLTALPDGIFSGLGQLRALDLRDNLLEDIEADLFQALVSLETLRLGGNQISALPGTVFSSLISLQNLHLNDNQLESVPTGLFDPLTNLVTLDLSGNDDLDALPTAAFDSLPLTAQINLPDDLVEPVTVQFSSASYDAQEGGAAATLTVTLSRDGRALSLPLSFDSSDNTSRGDYVITYDGETVTSSSGFTLEFPEVNGSVPSQMFRVAALDDDVDNPVSGSVTFSFGSLSRLDAVSAGSPEAAIVNLVDDTNAPQVTGVQHFTAPDQETALEFASPGTSIYSLVTFNEKMEEVASSRDSSRPEIFYISGTGATSQEDRFSIVDAEKAEELADDSCQATALIGTGQAYLCRHDVSASDVDPYLIKVGDASQDLAGNALSQDYLEVGGVALHGTDLCSRTAEVRDGIVAVIAEASSCAAVTEEQLADVSMLVLKGLGIRRLKGSDFADLSGLMMLDLSGNFLDQLPDELFEDLDDLTSLDLSNNRLVSVPVVSLAPLTGLQSLSLKNNRFSSLGVFPSLPLTELRLAENRLARIPEGVFDRLDSLKILDLSANRLVEVSGDFLDALDDLEELVLSENRLETIPSDFSVRLRDLERLDLSENQLAALAPESLERFSSLEALNLEENKLATLPADLFDALAALTELNLGSNLIEALPAEIFDSLTKLTSLDLSNNKLADIHENSFDELIVLRALNLSGNELERVPVTSFSESTALTALDLSSNQIRSLEESLFSKLVLLTSLRLNDNKLTSLAPGQFSAQTEIETLTLENNPLASLPAGIFDNLPLDAEISLPMGFLEPVQVTFESANHVAVENGPASMVTVTISRDGRSLEIPITITPGPGTGTDDFEVSYNGAAVNGSSLILIFPADSADPDDRVKQTVMVTAKGDNNDADHEFVFLAVGSLDADFVSVGEVGEAVVVLQDEHDDVSPEVVGVSHYADSGLQVPITFSAPGRQIYSVITFSENLSHQNANSAEARPVIFRRLGGSRTQFAVVAADEVLQSGSCQKAQRVTFGYVCLYEPGSGDAGSYRISVETDTTDLNDNKLAARFETDNTAFAIRAPGVCSRSEEVRDALVRAVEARSCGRVTDEQLRQIVSLDLSDSSINELSADDFYGLPNLDFLDLSDNELELEEGVFARLGTLKTLLLRNAPIPGLTGRIFTGLDDLQELDLSSGGLTNLPAGLFSEVPTLQVLRLNNNQLADIPEEIFASLTELRTLELNNNLLTSVSAQLFSSLGHLENLWLHSNPIFDLPQGVFDDLPLAVHIRLPNGLLEPTTARFESATYRAVEDQDSIRITVTLSRGGRAVELPVEIVHETSLEAGDYVVEYEGSSLTGQIIPLRFPATGDEAMRQTFTLLTEDDDVEDDQLTLRLTARPTEGVFVGSPANAVVTLEDRDFDPLSGIHASVSVASPSISEGEAAEFSLNLSEPAPAGGIRLRYLLEQSGDYIGPSALGMKTIDIAEGADAVTLTLATTEDDVNEVAGSVVLTLGEDVVFPPTYVLSPDLPLRATVSLEDNDLVSAVISGPSRVEVSDGAFELTVTFGDDVTEFDDPEDDILILNGLVTALRSESASVYKLLIDPAPEVRMISVQVVANAGRDRFDNGTLTSDVHLVVVARPSALIEPRQAAAETVLRRYTDRFESLTSTIVRDRISNRATNSWNLRADQDGVEDMKLALSCLPILYSDGCAWISGSFTGINGKVDGSVGDFYVGIDYFNQSLVLGVLAGASIFSLEVGDANYDALYQEAGLYSGFRLGSSLLVDLALGYGRSKPELELQGVDASFRSERLAARAAITGDGTWSLNWGLVRLAPQFGFSFAREEMDAFVDSIEERGDALVTKLGRLSLAPILTLNLGVLDVSLSIPMKWDVHVSDGKKGAFSAALETRLRIGFSQRVALILELENTGLADSDYGTFGFESSLDYRLGGDLALNLHADTVDRGVGISLRGRF